MQGFWAYIRFTALQLSNVVYQEGVYAQHADIPIAIYDALNNQLCQLNNTAQQQGLKVGMGLAASSALCSELIIIEYDAKQEHQYLREIAQQLYGVTADISLDKPNGLLLRIDNMLRLYHDIESYWQTIQALLSDHQYDYAGAYSCSAAKVLANAGYNRITFDRHSWKQALRRCNLKHSALTEKQIQALQRVGIQSFNDLLAQPLSALAARFDGPMLRYLSELKGDRYEQPMLFRPVQQFHKHTELLYEITHSDRLLKPLEYLLNHLERYLIQRALVVFDLTVSLQLRDNDTQQWQLHSAQGESRSQTWLAIAAVSVERLELKAPVQGLSLSATQLSPVVAANDDLFAGKQTHMTSLQLITRLQAKLGQQSIYQLQLNNDFRPEHINERVYPTSGDWALSQQTVSHLAERPALLLPNPQPLHNHNKILSAPERIVTGWWNETRCERDYFIAQNDDGQYLWVYRNSQNQWFIHGYFA